MQYKEKCAYWMNKSTGEDYGRIDKTLKLAKDIGIESVVLGSMSEKIIEAVKYNGLKAYADFHCFEGEKLWCEYPGSRPVGPDNTPISNEEWYFGANPAFGELSEKLEEDFKSLILIKGIDGVWLDFIRWPCHWEVYQPRLLQTSFDDYTVRRFFEETGIERRDAEAKDQILHECYNEWVLWRASIITSLVKKIWEIKNKNMPGIRLGLFGIPWLEKEYDGALLSIIGQDYLSLSGYIDVFSPMAYHIMCNRTVLWITDSITKIKTETGKYVLPAVQCVDVPKKMKEEEYAAMLNAVLENDSSDGIMIFELGQLLEGNKQDITRAVLTGNKNE